MVNLERQLSDCLFHMKEKRRYDILMSYIVKCEEKAYNYKVNQFVPNEQIKNMEVLRFV